MWVWQGLFQPAWGPYRNDNFLVPNKNGKYRFIISDMSANRHTLQDTGMLRRVEKFVKAFTGLPISSLIDFHSRYHHKMLHQDSWDYMAFLTKQGMCRPNRHVKGATNLVSALVRVSRTLLHVDLGSIAEIFIDNVGVKGPERQ